MQQPETSPAELFDAADAAARRGDIDDAIGMFREVARRSPGDSAALTRAGHLLLRKDRAADAIEALDEAVARSPENVTAWFLKGETAERSGNFSAAAKAYAKVVEWRPDLALAWSRLGFVSEKSGAIATSIPAFREAVRHEPLAADHHGNLARTLFEARMTEEAIPSFRRQLLISPNEADGYYNIGVCLPLVGAREAGLRAFRHTVILNPASGGAWSKIARLSRRLDPHTDVRKADTRAMVLDPDDPEPALRQAAFESSIQSEMKSRRRVACLEPDNLENLVEHARLLLRSGCPGDVLRLLLRVAKVPDPAEAVVEVFRDACEAAGETIPSWCRSAYQRWLDLYESPEPRDVSSAPGDDMLISVIMPVCDPPVELLRQAISSVTAQSWASWQLCIADDASRDPAVHAVLREAADDPRINVTFRPRNGHISAASNSALKAAEGKIVCFLDHDDLLAPDALFRVAEAFERRPDWQMVYSDEDKIDINGNRFDPHFKPDWNPDLLESQNYLCHLMAIRRPLVERLNGFTLGLEGSQDHDLALRAAEIAGQQGVGHIRRVLYHWRATPRSTAMGVEAKPYAAEATRRTLQAHHDRLGDGAVVRTLSNGWRAVRPTPSEPPLVSVIIPTRDRLELLRRCIDGLRLGTRYPALEILIVDNDSREKATLDYLGNLQSAGAVRVLKAAGPFNFSRLNNQAAKEAQGALLCFINNDVEPLSPDWLDEMVGHALRPGVGVVGAKLLYPNRRVQHGGIILCGHHVARHLHVGLPEDAHGHWGRAAAVQSMAAVTGACMVMRSKRFAEIGGCDEAWPVDFGDIDLCLRAGASGNRTIWTPHAVLLHHESASRGTYFTREKEEQYEAARAAMIKRWGETLELDPHYHPNLSIEPEDSPFNLAFPPRKAPVHG
jgi:GT2 family glycosyltransferase/tetratricopeptide (TPR) repeat protein